MSEERAEFVKICANMTESLGFNEKEPCQVLNMESMNKYLPVPIHYICDDPIKYNRSIIHHMVLCEICCKCWNLICKVKTVLQIGK